MPPFIPYGKHSVDPADIAEVIRVLQSDWLTCGPRVAEFEEAFAGTVGAVHCVALSSGTAALHAAMHALGVGPGDEIIVPTMTFAATANGVVYQGATPVFADVLEDSLLINPEQVGQKITKKTKAIIAVDYAGMPCDYDALQSLAQKNGIFLVADACHALGASYKSRPVGSLADVTAFSFHPVKHITTGEGGMVATGHAEFAKQMRSFRHHGIIREEGLFELCAPGGGGGEHPPWYYEMQSLGYNYRLNEMACALGLSQLKKLNEYVLRRQQIARQYDDAFCSPPFMRLGVQPLGRASYSHAHAFHLYVVRIKSALLGKDRNGVMAELKAVGVGTQVHYLPVHLHPFYRKMFHTAPGDCPVAEQAAEEILSLPLFPAMTDEEVVQVIHAVRQVCGVGLE